MAVRLLKLSYVEGFGGSLGGRRKPKDRPFVAYG